MPSVPSATLTTMADLRSVDFSGAVLGQVVTGPRTKTAPLSCNGLRVLFKVGTLEDAVEVPFHPSAFGEAEPSRVTLLLTLTEEQAQAIRTLEAAVLSCMQSDPQRFGKGCTAASIEAQFHTTLKQMNDGRVCLKTKLALTGAHAVKFWLPDGTSAAMPENMGDSRVCANLHARGVWVTSAGIGLLVEGTDLLLVCGKTHTSPWV
jgi:hypothetical protein